MIWNEELSASLDQSTGVVVFHRIELSRPQQLAQVIAEKVSNMVEQNEKALDVKLGSATGWGDRGDAKGEKRGEQAQERRGRGERTRGSRGKSCFCDLRRWIDCTQQVVVSVVVLVLRKGLETRCQAMLFRKLDTAHRLL